MSTYYYLGCKKCKKQGGFFSRQMWGAGNADVLDTMRFLMKHTIRCGPEEIVVFGEWDDYGEWPEENGELLAQVFPCSSEWSDEVYKIREKEKSLGLNKSLWEEEENELGEKQ